MIPETLYFDLHGVPYVQIFSEDGNASVFNCGVEPPVKMDSYQRLPNWVQISALTFNHLRDAYLAAAQVEKTLAAEAENAAHVVRPHSPLGEN